MRVDIASRLRLFDEQGWRIVFVCCGEVRDDGESTDLPDGIEFHCFPDRARKAVSAQAPAVQAILDRERPDLVWCEYAFTAPLAAALEPHGAPIWFRPHNFELAHRREKVIMRRKRRWRGWMDWVFSGRPARYHRLERLMFRTADRVFFISPQDQAAMMRVYRRAVDNAWLPPLVESPPCPVHPDKSPLDVIYVSANYRDAIQAAGAREFVEELAPAVEGALPDRFLFHLVGRGAHTWASGREIPPFVRVHDFVPDLETFFQGVDVVAVPVRGGWGCKLKTVDGLVRGLPVVGSREAFRGVPAIEGAYYACDSVDDYIAAFRELLDPERRARVGEAGRTAYTGWLADGRRILVEELARIRGAGPVRPSEER
jgi:hypothetical protein